LFAIAAVIVIGVLAAVMLVIASSLQKYEIGRLDARLCMEARRLATPLSPGVDLDRLEADVAGKLLLLAPEQMMFLAQGANAAAAIRSTHWRDYVALDRLDWAPAPTRYSYIPNKRLPAAHGQPSPAVPYAAGDCDLASFSSPDDLWRMARFSLPGGVGYVAASTAAAKRELRGALHDALVRVIPLALGLALLGAWLIASLTMRPLNRLREAMKRTTQKGLDERLPTAGENREFKELIDAYNSMLERLETSFHQASRFSADAAHELRTPLTLLRGRIEQAIGRSDNRAIQGDLTEMQNDVGRLTAITRKLLLLSQADAGRLALLIARLDLSSVLDDLIDDARMLVEDRQVRSQVARGLTVDADELLLRQLFNNLISNALRYSPTGGWIQIDARAEPGGVEVIFANASQAIDPEQRRHLFDRFYRGQAARDQGGEGSGLGLSLAREIARAHGGDLTLEASPDDEVRLRLWLPLK
jgi:signal transduction histidine kinase